MIGVFSRCLDPIKRFKSGATLSNPMTLKPLTCATQQLHIAALFKTHGHESIIVL